MTPRRELTKAERVAIAGHVAQARLARLAQFVAGLGGLVGAFWCGTPSIILGVAGVAFFGLARPAPTQELDEATGRGRR